MKKVLLIVLFIAGAYQTKAQQLQLKPLDSTLIRSPDLFHNLKPNDDAPLKNHFKVQPNQSLKDLDKLTQSVNAIPFASTMPVAKLSSDDRMPIVKVASDDHMPVLKLKTLDLLKSLTPLPTP